METATYIGCFGTVFAVLACIASYMRGRAEGYRKGVLDYYNADDAEKAAMLLDTRQ